MRYRTTFATIEDARTYLSDEKFRTTTLLANNAYYNVFVSTGAIIERSAGAWQVTYYDLYDSREANRFRLAADREAA